MPKSSRRLSLPALPQNFSKPSCSGTICSRIAPAGEPDCGVCDFRPLGGSAEELDQQLRELQGQFTREQFQLKRARALVAKIEQARTSGDAFMQNYFISRRTLSSTIVSELHQAAKEAGIKKAQHSFTIDPIEGSDTLSMVTVVGNYEGTYGDLLQFVNRLDKSGRFLIIDSMSAAPMTGTGNLAINIKLNTFVREDGPTV